MNHVIFVIMDSCRYDSYLAAAKPNLDAFCECNGIKAERRYSYASWTSPSHQTFLMGMMPHSSPAGVFASEVYKGDFIKWVDRTGIAGMSFKSFLPQLSLPKVLKDLGYRTVARVSLPVLNQTTTFSAHFDDYRLMADHNDFAGMVREASFEGAQPVFNFWNLGETHYPYMLKDAELPHISGVHGVFKHMDDFVVHQGDPGTFEPGAFFGKSDMERLRLQQVRAVEYLDSQFSLLFAKVPVGTHVIVTADHGELFGEEGYFGHGPVMHEKCFEVPFLEGKVTGRLKDLLT